MKNQILIHKKRELFIYLNWQVNTYFIITYLHFKIIDYRMTKFIYQLAAFHTGLRLEELIISNKHLFDKRVCLLCLFNKCVISVSVKEIYLWVVHIHRGSQYALYPSVSLSHSIPSNKRIRRSIQHLNPIGFKS